MDKAIQKFLARFRPDTTESAQNFAKFLVQCYELKICRNRKTIQPSDVIAFFYKDVPGQIGNYASFRDIAYSMPFDTFSRETVLELAEYFYTRVSDTIRQKALASLLRCLDVDVRQLTGIDFLHWFESGAGCKKAWSRQRYHSVISSSSFTYCDTQTSCCQEALRYGSINRMSNYANLHYTIMWSDCIM